MAQNRFISNPAVPWVEVRRTEQSEASYKDHSHPELSVGAVTHGSTRLKVRGREELLSNDSLVIIAPHTVHSCNPHNGPRSYLMVYFADAWCHALLRELGGPAQNLRLPDWHVVKDAELFTRLTGLVEGLGKPGFALQTSEQWTQFCADLLVATTCREHPEQSEPPQVINATKTTLSRSLEHNLTLQQLADRVGYNPYTLLRCFKKNVGLTPHEYLLNLRIAKAKELLRDGLAPAAVAAETGFVDQSHFHRTFRQFVAATPRQYQLRS